MSVESYHGTAQSVLAVGPTHEHRPVHLPLKDHCDVVVAVLNDTNMFLIILAEEKQILPASLPSSDAAHFSAFLPHHLLRPRILVSRRHPQSWGHHCSLLAFKAVEV